MPKEIFKATAALQEGVKVDVQARGSILRLTSLPT